MLENSVEGVSCPDNKQHMLLIMSGHEKLFMEFSNTTEIHCTRTVDFTYNDTAYSVDQVVTQLSQDCHVVVTNL